MCVHAYMHTCMHAQKISILLLTKAITQFTFFLLVTVMFDKEFFLKLKNFPSLKRIYFFIIVLKHTQYFT